MPETAGRFGALPWLWLSVIVFVLDQVTKLYFEGSLQMYQQIVVIPDYFSWTLAYNTGAAFSFLADHGGWQRWLFAVIAIGVSAVLVVWLRRLPRRGQGWLALGLALVLGGALGNLFDRVAYGHVIDFLDVHTHVQPFSGWLVAAFGTPHWPTFNIADTGLTCGATLLIYEFVFRRPSPPRAT